MTTLETAAEVAAVAEVGARKRPASRTIAVLRLALLLAWPLLAPGGHAAEEPVPAAVSASSPRLDPDWLEAIRFEYARQYDHAAHAYERIFESHPTRSEAAWRAARSFWQLGEETLPEAPELREERFERAETLAGKGLAANPRCGECALWMYASMGRLVEHRGTVWAARHASDLRDLLERGIAAKPTHRDPDGNSALGNLYYSSAIFHRMVPEWFWLPMIVGVKGDTKRALADIEHALAISGDRIDYQIEHGAVLLCRAKRARDEESARRGVQVLQHAIALPPKQRSDAIDQHYAQLLIDDPSVACGFTRRGFLDVEAMGREAKIGH